MKKKYIIFSIILLIVILLPIFYNKYFKDISTSNIDNNIDWSKYETYNIKLTKSITIKKEGVYNLSGSIKNGSIKINTKGNVKLVIDNITITNSNGPSILVDDANTVVISSLKESINKLDGGNNNEYNGCIYSSSDIIFEGEGILNINSNKDGIISKDNLTINSGTINITSSDDGIIGKDSVYIKNGDITINSNGDAIKSTNTKDKSKGYIKVDNGNIDITTTGDDDNSSKGLKAVNTITIKDGEFNINTSDDSLHSDNNININGGNYTISSEDDAIHADNKLSITSGNINIIKSYEGLESNNIIINDGNIDIVATDDGINAAGGNDQSGSINANESTSSKVLTINNGNININASGDGLDANGSIYINGGNINVEGPENDGNGAIDYDKELVFTKGELLASGSSGMAQGISESSTSYGVLINFDTTYSMGTNFVLVDSSGNEIFNYTANKKISSIAYASDKLATGEYKVLVNNEEYTSFTITSISTKVGNSGFMGGNIKMPESR